MNIQEYDRLLVANLRTTADAAELHGMNAAELIDTLEERDDVQDELMDLLHDCEADFLTPAEIVKKLREAAIQYEPLAD